MSNLPPKPPIPPRPPIRPQATPASDPTMNTDISDEIFTPTMENAHLKVLIYGEYGTGKTTLAATAEMDPRLSPILILSAEAGTLAVIKDARTPIKKTPQVYDLRDKGTVKPSIERLKRAYWYLAKGDHPYKTVVIDTFSEVANTVLDQVVGSKIGKKSQSGASRETEDDVWVEDYGEMTQIMRRWGRQFRDLPMNVIMTCHVSSDKEEKQFFPNLTPKLRSSVLGAMDIVGYLYKEDRVVPTGQFREDGSEIKKLEEHWKLLVDKTPRFTAKDRSPGRRLGKLMTDPTMTTIMDAVTGEALDLQPIEEESEG